MASIPIAQIVGEYSVAVVPAEFCLFLDSHKMSHNSTVITGHFACGAVASLMILITTKITIFFCITAAKGGG